MCGLTAIASAPAKIILSGERFVVFGERDLGGNGKLKSVVNAIEKASGTAFVAKKSDEGVRIES